jgi:hypothetical protein
MKTQSIMKSVSNINISVSASAHQRKKRGWRQQWRGNDSIWRRNGGNGQ